MHEIEKSINQQATSRNTDGKILGSRKECLITSANIVNSIHKCQWDAIKFFEKKRQHTTISNMKMCTQNWLKHLQKPW